ncbi:MAG: hypothetical protein AAB540_00990 [Patescibacteria group bacterium]
MEKFQRKEWDKYGGTTTKYNVEDSRSKTRDTNAAATRITGALFAGKEFVLPGEIVNKRGVSLRVDDLRGDFATIVRQAIGQQTDKRTIRELEESIGFTHAEVEKSMTEDGKTAELQPGQLVYLLSEKFYLTRLPYYEALNIFLHSIDTAYLRELLRRYPNDPKKRAELAGVGEQELESFIKQRNPNGSPLPLNYDLSPLPDSSFPTLDALADDDDALFSANYVYNLKTRTGNNFKEMMELSALSENDLKELLTNFPQQ